MKRLVILTVAVILLIQPCSLATVTVQSHVIGYNCDGATKTFAYTFPTTINTDLIVTLETEATGVKVPLTLTTHYSATVGSTGGTVTTVAAYAATYNIYIERRTPRTQTLNLVAGGVFNPVLLTAAYDKAIKLIIELYNNSLLAIHAPSTEYTLDMELPSAIDRAGKYLAFGATGLPIATTGTSETTTHSVLGASIASATDEAAFKEIVNLEIGTDVQAYDPNLDILEDILGYWERILVGTLTNADRLSAKDGLNLDHVFDVRDYDATGDGVTDDQAAINAAIAASGGTAPAGSYDWTFGGATVLLPSGSYRITSDIVMRNNVHLRGAGVEATQIIVDGDCNGISAPRYSQNWTISDLSIRPRATGADVNCAGIHIHDTARCFSVSNIHIGPVNAADDPLFDYGLKLGSTTTGAVYLGTIEDVYIWSARLYPCYVYRGSEVVFQRCTFTTGGQDFTTAGMYLGGYGCLLAECSWEAAFPIGLHLVGSNNKLIRPWIETDNYTGALATWGIIIERVGANLWDSGNGNSIDTALWSSDMDNSGGYLKIIGGTRNIISHPRMGGLEADMILIEGANAKINTFEHGNVAWTQIITVEDPEVNRLNIVSDSYDGTPVELAVAYFEGEETYPSEFTIGSDVTGVGLRANEATVSDLARAGLVADTDGDVTLKSATVASKVVKLAAGASNTVTGQASDTEFLMPLDATVVNDLAVGKVPLPAGRWKLNDSAASTTVDDSSTNGYDLTAQANTDTLDATGQVGTGCLTFNGTTDYLIRAAETYTHQQGTVSFWCKPTVVNALQFMFASCDEALATKVFYIGLTNTGYLTYGQRSADVYDQATGSTLFVAGQWHHVSVSSNGSTITARVNGVSQTLTFTSGANTGDWIGDTADRDNLTVGCRKTSAGAAYFFSGSIDDVWVFDAPLTTTESDYMYTSTDEDLNGTLTVNGTNITDVQDDLVTLSGVASGSTHLGTFTGTTITDNQTIQAALQLLETAVEGSGAGASYTFTDENASPDAAGMLKYDNTVTGFDDGALVWYDDDEIRTVIDLDASETVEAADDAKILRFNWNGGAGYFDLVAAAGGGDVTDVWAGAGPNVDALTAAAGDSLNATDADSTIPWKVNAAAAPTAEGAAIWESDADTLRVGDGAATLTVAMTRDKLSAFAATTSAELMGVLSDEQGTGVMVGSDSPTFVDDITVAAAGVKLTGANGMLTILGLGDGSDEDIKLDLNTTANTLTITSPSSSLDKIDASGITITATGFAGALTGNVTGDASGSSGSCTGNALTATTASAGDSATAFFSAGTIEHEYGGLEADVSAYNGFVKISGGSTSAVTANAGTDLTADLEEEVTEGSLADSTIVSDDIKNATITNDDIATASKTFGINFVIDGGGSEIADGIKGDIEIPFAGTITSVRLLADQSGSIVVDIWEDTYANFPPTDADTSTSATPPTITTAVKSEDTTLTSWDVTLAAGDILRINVDSCTTITRCTVSICGTKL